MKLMSKDIARLIAHLETAHVECKEAKGGLPDSLWETYSAFANPGGFRVSKAVAVAGGTSDARNSHIFNIFSLVEIGERSGMGLSDLFGQWKKCGFASPEIREEYDPERVTVNVCIGSQPDQNPTKTRPKPDQWR